MHVFRIPFFCGDGDVLFLSDDLWLSLEFGIGSDEVRKGI